MIIGLLLLFLGGCAVWDVRTGRIPNLWVVLWLSLFILEAAFRGGGWQQSVTAVCILLRGAAFTIAILFPLFLFRMTGAGDVKMMSLICGALGLRNGCEVIFFGLAAAAAWSFIYMVRRRILMKRIVYFLNFIRKLLRADWTGPYYLEERDGKEAGFCLAPFILGGFVLWLAVKGGM